ncbi:hypothetical protein TRAPUB_4676 [Trametes pubescens]|uniref:Uncharacterized protein n=1 Tax=Trametes pubescens TaxID=154538 RepID=A0A1M2VAF1_TRAPU|nr:hypothetical protein TRAPUB_4676 [Trametes pubescens]
MSTQPNPSKRVRRRKKLLWHYGFPWTFVEAFKLARTLKASGADIWPPLEDELDIERDFDSGLAGTELSSQAGRGVELSRAVDILKWGTDYLQHKTQFDLQHNELPTVHTGVTGTTRRQTDVLLMASARARRVTDLNIEDLRNAGKLPEDATLAILSEYLGEPQWFMDWKYLKDHDLLDSLESGQYQAQVGIIVPQIDSAASV